MAVTGIYTTLADTALGSPTPSDGICLLACPAVAQSATGGLQFDLLTAYLITSRKDLENMGVTEQQNARLLFNVGEFFEKAGEGARLWVVGFGDTSSDFETFIETNLADVVRSTTVTNFDNRPRIIGIVGSSEYVTTEEGKCLPQFVLDAAPKLNTTLSTLFNESYRTCAVLDGMSLDCAAETGMVTEQTATTLADAGALTAPRVGIQITTSTPGQSASIGETLGIQAGISLATSIGSMSLPAVRQTEYFIDRSGDEKINTPVSAVKRATYDDLGQKQFIFTRTRPQMPGVYFNDGATCNLPTNALSSLEFIRVGNAVCDSVEAFFVRLINTGIPTLANGSIDPAYKSSTLADLYDRYLKPRINRGEAQDIQVDFAAKDGNFIQSRAIVVTVKILPLASLREVYEEVFFVSSLN